MSSVPATQDTPPVLAGRSPAMADLAEQVDALASRGDVTGLLMGEAGVGKGAIAELIHERSPRARRAFVVVHCLAPGAEARLRATDERAPRRRAGRGTLFISEIGCLSPEGQRLLAGWLADEQWESSGPRLLASSAADLVAAVTDGLFSEELYYRLAVMPIVVPPLRARTLDDLGDLIRALAGELSAEIPDAPREIAAAAIDRLAKRPWPGNLRELRNALERSVLRGRGVATLEVDHLPPEIRGGDPFGSEGEYAARTLAEVERIQIERTLRATRHNRTRAAEALGISRATLIKKIREYGLGARPRAAAGG